MEIFVVDAFAGQVFAGNPAAVCRYDFDLSGRVMQQIANEMNLSATAFVRHRAGEDWDLRWFTPHREIDLCGHGSLASAFVLARGGHGDTDVGERTAQTSADSARDRVFRFHSRSGVLTVLADAVYGGSLSGRLAMDFPRYPLFEPLDAPLIRRQVQDLLPFTADLIGFFDKWVMVQAPSEAAVLDFRPDFPKIAAVHQGALALSAVASGHTPSHASHVSLQPPDIVSRCFLPAFGTPEDAATGSAHCGLAVYWAQQLGKNLIRARQASPRGGWLELELAGSDRVWLRGQAVLVSSGTLYID